MLYHACKHPFRLMVGVHAVKPLDEVDEGCFSAPASFAYELEDRPSHGRKLTSHRGPMMYASMYIRAMPTAMPMQTKPTPVSMLASLLVRR